MLYGFGNYETEESSLLTIKSLRIQCVFAHKSSTLIPEREKTSRIHLHTTFLSNSKSDGQENCSRPRTNVENMNTDNQENHFRLCW